MFNISEIDLVIARYEETLVWLDSTLKHLKDTFQNVRLNVFIYNKSCSPDKDAELESLVQALNKGANNCIRVIELPNIGRESHTYLYHLVDNYNRFECQKEHIAVVCLQGGCDDHMKTWFKGYVMNTLITAFINDTKLHGASLSWAKKHEYVGGNAAHWDFNIRRHNNKDLFPLENTSLGPWFNENIKENGMSTSSLLNWWIAGLFCVHAQRITAHPKDYYERLLNQLHLQHLDPEVGHFFERSWVYITGADQGLSNMYKDTYILAKGGKKLL